MLLSGGELPVPVLIVIAWIPPAIQCVRLGHTWRDVEDAIAHGMSLSLKAVAILMVVGATIASWAACGTIATMIDYGLAVLAPSWFLPAALLMCAVGALAIGSSWATAATVGVALIGIGGALGISLPLCAGAVVSGCYFGDKMSPLSDTTNLAPGVAGTDLFTHIHAMLYTTVPAIVIALLLFTIIGLNQDLAAGYDASSVDALRAALAAGQGLSPWMLLPPALVVLLALLRIPALPVLVLASGVGVVLALVAQDAALGTLLASLYSGHVSESGFKGVDSLLSRGGIASMADTIALVLAATALGGIFEKGELIKVLLEALLTRVRTIGGLITSTVGSCIGVNTLLADQYLSIVLPGRMFRDAFLRKGLAPRMLSRTLEDAGTVTSALIPWNTCGAFMAATLGVSTYAYFPYAFFNLAMPVIAIFYAWTGIFILRDSHEDRGHSRSG